MRSLPLPLAGFTLVALAAGCNRSPEPPTGAASAAVDVRAEGRPPASGAPGSPGARPRSTVTVHAPEGWTKADKPGPMRRETYVVPRAPGDPEDGDLSVSQAGGSVDNNISRWARQFGVGARDAKRTKKTVGALAVTIVELHGEYSAMAIPGVSTPGKKSGWAMRAAIVESTPLTFIKLTGPEKTVAAAAADFDRMIAGISST